MSKTMKMLRMLCVALASLWATGALAHNPNQYFIVKDVGFPQEGRIGKVEGKLAIVSNTPDRPLSLAILREGAALPKFGVKVNQDKLARLAAPGTRITPLRARGDASVPFSLNIGDAP